MDSFYKIGRAPTLDAFADYLAAFIKMRYRNRRVTIVGISFGFLVVTRMLQRYPELCKRIDLVVSIVGFMHRDDFTFPPRRRRYCVPLRVFLTAARSFRDSLWVFESFVIRGLYVRLPAGRRRLLLWIRKILRL